MKVRHLPVLSLCLLPTLAWAHPGHDSQSLIAGLAHPWSGLDHMMAMLAIGMWATQLGRRMRWLIPFCFVGMMNVGAALSFGGIAIGGVEQGIAVSVCLLGLLLATAMRLPVAISIALTGCFAIFHGYAHTIETLNGNAFAYIAGFSISTAVLHALGVAIALLLNQRQTLIRWVGAGIAISGAALLLT